MTLTRTFPTDRAAGLPLADTRLLVAAMVESDTTGKPRAGVLPSHYNPLVTGTAGMAYSVAAFSAVTVRAGMGAELVANDGAATVATTAAPGANSRIDVIWVRSLFTTYADGSSDPVFGVTQGVAAASPAKPAIPAGALELATAVVLSTTTQTSTAVITQTFPYTATEGGVVPVRNATELAAWAPADGALAWRIDTSQLLIYMANAAVPDWYQIGGKPAISAITYTGIYAAGTPAARIVEHSGRISLEGLVTSSSATFVAGTAYTIGSVSAAKAPAADRTFPIYLNDAVGFATVTSTGNIVFAALTGFTGILRLSLAGMSWPNKNLQ